jgi:hypothetical protein
MPEMREESMPMEMMPPEQEMMPPEQGMLRWKQMNF